MNLEELYIQRNEYARQGDVENVERITKEIEDMLPTKPKQVLTIDGKPAQFEIVGITENADYLKPLYLDGSEKYDRPYVNGKRMYSRLLIKKVS